MGYLDRSTALSGYLINSPRASPTRVGKKNHLVAIPGTSSDEGCGAYRLCWPSASSDRLELALCKESDVATVGRPKWQCCAIGARHGFSLKCIQRPKPELALVPNLSRKRD